MNKTKNSGAGRYFMAIIFDTEKPPKKLADIDEMDKWVYMQQLGDQATGLSLKALGDRTQKKIIDLFLGKN